MLYKPFQNINLSCLGMGAMRLPKTGEGEKIDERQAREIIEYAYSNGVNYFDTAYRYHAGESETFIGKALKDKKRDSFYLATKFPGHMMEKTEDGKLKFTGLLAGHPPAASVSDIFDQQLEKCGVDYFDFYLLHNVCETAWDFYTDEEIGCIRYLLEQKRKGRIRHLGFSAHARAETIEKFLDKYDCFEFVQIQLNYLDWTLQNAGKKYEIVTKHGLPVVVMEPCRGGKLASINENLNALLKEKRPDASIASWAFRFLQSLPGVQVVLSGMTTLEQLKDNIKTFSENDPTDEAEKELLFTIAGKLADTVPCTACRYCCEDCPQSLDIPKLISLYNEHTYGKTANLPFTTLPFTMGAMKPEELPSACIACGSCAKVCPQNIDIPAVLGKFAEALKSKTA
ncbi:oxidoreductase [Spirochaetia bacterium]|nr:oxidoreductase [Spirochaetia bacterium]